MSDSVKWLLWLLGMILMLWTGLGWESCRQQGWEQVICDDCATVQPAVPAVPEPTVTPPPVESRYPVDFEKSSFTANTNEGYDAYRTRILEGYKDGQVLEITGDYYPDESTPEGFLNAGMARAAAVRDLLTPDIPAERIILKSNLLSDTTDASFINGHSYHWVSEAPKEVEEINGCTTIRFAFNSADGQLSNEIKESLDNIAKRVRETGENIMITGHTDDVGNDGSNMRLGKNRAMDIRREFINRRVLREQIKTDSKGKSDPVSSNDTDRGRAENRRVEVCINK